MATPLMGRVFQIRYTAVLRMQLQLRKYDSLLVLVLSLAVGVTDLAHFVGLEEENLAETFVGVDARGQRRCVRYLQRDEAFPLGLERGDVDNDSAARRRWICRRRW